MCNDPDCIFRFVLEEQYRQDICRQYEERHARLMSIPRHDIPPVEYPSPERMRKMVKKRIDYTVKYWSKHRSY